MNAKQIILVVLLLAVLAGTFLAGKYSGSSKELNTVLTGESISFSQAVGLKAPDFELNDINENKVRLSSLRGKKVVLFFTEGAMCYPSCWNQIGALGSDSRFNNQDTASYSIVVDPPSDWKKIISRYPKLGSANLLFDTKRQASVAYDVLYVDSSMHKGGFPGHTYFIIDKEGIIRYTLDDPRMGIRNEELAKQLLKV